MRVLVVGAGAIGCLLAARLARAGNELLLLARPRELEPLRSAGILVEGTDPDRQVVPVSVADEPFEAPEGAILAVKSFDLPEAAGSLARFGGLPVLLVQNGLDIDSPVRAGLRDRGADPSNFPRVRAINTLPATWLGPGRVRQAGEGGLLLPARPPPELADATERWATLLGGAGLSVRRVEEFPREVFRKLLLNAAINPVTADHGILNGRVSEEPWRSQALSLLREGLLIARAEGYEFSEPEIVADLFRVVRATATNRSSMLQDLERGRPTEIDAISGALLELGAARGIELPATRRAAERIRARASGRLPPPGPPQGS